MPLFLLPLFLLDPDIEAQQFAKATGLKYLQAFRYKNMASAYTEAMRQVLLDRGPTATDNEERRLLTICDEARRIEELWVHIADVLNAAKTPKERWDALRYIKDRTAADRPLMNQLPYPVPRAAFILGQRRLR
jgi:hypothetical protein